MAKVRVKVPVEPKIMEYPAIPDGSDSNRAAHLLQTPAANAPTSIDAPARAVTLSYKTLVIIGVVLLGALLLTVVVATRNNARTAAPTQTTDTNGDTEAKQLYAKLSKSVLLPADELPTVANVSKEELAKEQTGLTDLQENDKVLLFAKARKAVVYRPSVDKVVAVVTLAAPAQSNN